MKEELIILHELSVARLLKTFAIELGVSEAFADVLAQVHVAKSPLLRAWSAFFQTNCIQCSHAPASCGFFHPRAEACVAGATPATTRNANIVMVEAGHLLKCPVISRQE